MAAFNHNAPRVVKRAVRIDDGPVVFDPLACISTLCVILGGQRA